MGTSLSVGIGDDVGTGGTEGRDGAVAIVVVAGSRAAGGGGWSSRRATLRVSAAQRSSTTLNDAANANMATIDRIATTMAMPESRSAVTS